MASKVGQGINYTSVLLGIIGLATAYFSYAEKVEATKLAEIERTAKEAKQDTIAMIVNEHREFIRKEKQKNEKLDKLLALLDSL